MSIADVIIGSMSEHELPSGYWISNPNYFPELHKSRTIIQKDGKTVFHHTMRVLDLLDIRNPVTIWSALFHDLGKGHDKYLYPNSKSKKPHFSGHADTSAYIAVKYLNQWNVDTDTMDKVARIIKTHMFDIKCNMTPKTIRNFIANVGMDNIRNWFTVRCADSASYSSTDKYVSNIIDPFRTLIQKELNKASKDFGLSVDKGDSGMQISGE